MALADTTKYVCAYSYTTLPSANLLIDTVQYSRSTVSFFDRSLREDDIPYDVAIPSAHQNHDENGSNKYTMMHVKLTLTMKELKISTCIHVYLLYSREEVSMDDFDGIVTLSRMRLHPLASHARLLNGTA